MMLNTITWGNQYECVAAEALRRHGYAVEVVGSNYDEPDLIVDFGEDGCLFGEVKTARCTENRPGQMGYQFFLRSKNRHKAIDEDFVMLQCVGRCRVVAVFVMPSRECAHVTKIFIPKQISTYTGQWSQWLNGWQVPNELNRQRNAETEIPNTVLA